MNDIEMALEAMRKFRYARENALDRPLSSSALENYKLAWSEVLAHEKVIMHLLEQAVASAEQKGQSHE